MPLPYKEPGMAMMSLVTNMVETGQRVGATSEVAVGEGRADAPVGTTLALIDQATKILNSVHKRIHASQAEEFQLLVRCFREHPESFWRKCKRPTYDWNEQTFIHALNDCELVPQADPNTASHTQRIMKIMALKQLQQQNPGMYDPIAIDIAAMKAMGWSNPEQFMAPMSSQGKMPPEMQQKIEELKIKKQDADARTLMAQTKAQAEMAKAQGFASGGQVQNPVEDQIKMADLQLRDREIQTKATDAQLDAANRQRDRESRERLAAIKLATELVKDPSAAGLVTNVLTPDMIQELEGEEPPLVGDLNNAPQI
jgi:hypothetical protein